MGIGYKNYEIELENGIAKIDNTMEEETLFLITSENDTMAEAITIATDLLKNCLIAIKNALTTNYNKVKVTTVITDNVYYRYKIVQTEECIEIFYEEDGNDLVDNKMTLKKLSENDKNKILMLLDCVIEETN